MQENPIVSVVCLCYNHSNFVIESLKSIQNQTYENIEIIIIDDFSADNSVKIINEFVENSPKIKFIVNKKNIGNTKSFNQALRIAKGKYIIDLAADDVLIPNCIDLQLDKFNKSKFPNLGIVYGNAENILENGEHDSYYFKINNEKKVINKIATGDVYQTIISSGNNFCSVSAMIKKTVFDDLTGYDESLVYEDLDFWIRASRTYEIDFIDAILVKKRILKNSLGSQFLNKNHKINESTYLILKKATSLNKSKTEDLSLLTRINYEIFNCYKYKIYRLLIKNLNLKIYLNFRILFSFLKPK